MCERDGCACEMTAKTINDIAKELAELDAPTELENNHNQEGDTNVHSTDAG